MNTAAQPSLSGLDDDIRSMKRASRWMIVLCAAISAVVVLVAVAGVWPPHRGPAQMTTPST